MHRTPEVYRCNLFLRGRDLPPEARGPMQSVRVERDLIAGEVWQRVESVLCQPQIIRAEIEPLMPNDPTAAGPECVNRTVRDLARQGDNYRQALGLAQTPHALAAIAAEPDRVSPQLASLEQQRELLSRRAGWQHAIDNAALLEARLAAMRRKLDELDYPMRRAALAMFGVRVRVYPMVAPERWRIEANIPIPMPAVSCGRTPPCPGWPSPRTTSNRRSSGPGSHASQRTPSLSASNYSEAQRRHWRSTA